MDTNENCVCFFFLKKLFKWCIGLVCCQWNGTGVSEEFIIECMFVFIKFSGKYGEQEEKQKQVHTYLMDKVLDLVVKSLVFILLMHRG